MSMAEWGGPAFVLGNLHEQYAFLPTASAVHALHAVRGAAATWRCSERQLAALTPEGGASSGSRCPPLQLT